ncbi:hypothetical protein LJC69_04380 [Bacteroidales bacterium OttesenSCG-928-K22]|nr:hypothetical protein [Bacteroidales bacterium OttesenSCG-928-K22]
MKIFLKILGSIILIILLALVGYELYRVILWGIGDWKLYIWLFIGVAAYFLLRLLFRKNEKWLQTFSHELSHTIVGFFFFKKIHSFQAKEGTGEIWHSGSGNIFISLAPYCLPIFTYLFLFLRLLSDPTKTYIFDIFIGFTLAFHILCFIKQTGKWQTDITNHGVFLSYLFIITFALFNLLVVFLSIRMGVIDAFVYMFKSFWYDINGIWIRLMQIAHG